MIIRLLNPKYNFINNKITVIDFNESPVEPDTPDIPDIPDTPDIPVEDVVPEVYTTFASTYARSSMTEEQKIGLAKYLYKLNNHGILAKTRQLYLPCVMPDWEHCLMNVARFFNEDTVEYITPTGVSNSTLGQCFQLCDYGIYKTSTEIKWGDCITYNWPDEDVTCDNWHILMFKPAQQDASTGVGSAGLNLRASKANTKFAFQIGQGVSTTQRVRGSWGSGTVKIGEETVNIKDGLFTFPAGWGNGTHDPYCVGLSIKDQKLITPSSNYQEFGYNNRNLVNEINEMELSGNYELPTTSMTGPYSWGGYNGGSISTQESLATSIVSIGQGLTASEIQNYMDATDEFMEILGIKNNNWDPDNL